MLQKFPWVIQFNKLVGLEIDGQLLQICMYFAEITVSSVIVRNSGLMCVCVCVCGHSVVQCTLVLLLLIEYGQFVRTQIKFTYVIFFMYGKKVSIVLELMTGSHTCVHYSSNPHKQFDE
ncbi:hypothetical protein BsWGS_16739 [Bradybaena similaris]